ncbi:MAG TPA: hypothetical protein V6D05_12300, partial [Stenomitos sp.]
VPTKHVSAAEGTVLRRSYKLGHTNVAVVLPTDPARFMEFAKTGKVLTDGGTFSVRNVSQAVQEKGGFSAFVLSKGGKKHLASETGLDDALANGLKGVTDKHRESSYNNGLRFGSETRLAKEVSLHDDVQNVLIDAQAYGSFMDTYGAAVAKGEVPATLAGKPFTDFFRSSDDLFNDLEIEAFKRTVPGFAEKTLDEQKAVAALAGRVATDFPQDVSEATRRKVAASMVTYKPVEGAAATGVNPVAELKSFYHGTAPGAGEKIVKDGFKVGEGDRYGAGIYYANPTASSGYTYKRPSEGAEILSGQVDVGKVITTPHGKILDSNTRFVNRAKLDIPDNGDYWVTWEPKRFTVKAITSYDPKAAGALDAVIPDLLEAFPKAPKWSSDMLSKVDPARARRAYEHALKSLDAGTYQAAGIQLAKEGHPQGIAIALKTLKEAKTPEVQGTAMDALIQATAAMGPGRAQEATPIIQAVMGAAKSKYDAGAQLLKNLGDGAFPALEAAGFNQSPLSKMGSWLRQKARAAGSAMFNP